MDWNGNQCPMAEGGAAGILTADGKASITGVQQVRNVCVDRGPHVSCPYIFILPQIPHIHGGICKKSIDLEYRAAADAHCHTQRLEHFRNLYLYVRKAQ